MRRSFYKQRDYPEPTVTYDQLDEMLREHPAVELPGYRPAPTNDPERDKIAELLSARVYWDGPVSNQLVGFYRKRISRALNEVENTPAPEKGVIVWKMYSSGTIVKSREGTFAFDVVEGPVPTVPILPEDLPASPKHYTMGGQEVEEVYLPPIAKEMNTGPLPRMNPPMTNWKSIKICHPKLFWTPAMRHQYTNLIDVHFVTHYHWDHFGVMLTAEVLKAGKTVVAPPQVKQLCIKWDLAGADEIFTPLQERSNFLESKEYKVKGIRLINFPGFQGEYSTEREGDRLIWTVRRGETVEMYAYVVELGGLNVFVTGEVRNCPYFYPWLVNLRQSEWQPDSCLAVPGIYEGFLDHLTKLFDPAIITLHELEFGHTVLRVFEEDSRPLFFGREISGNDLFWGDQIHIVKQ